MSLSRRAPALLTILAVACAAPDAAKDVVVDTGGDTAADDTADTGEEIPEGLHGVAPDAPVALPTFAARNQHGEARSEADLLGHPTVLWFYPAAGTFG